MKRLGASFLGALVVVLAMFWPAVNFFSTTDETPEFARITDYQATFDVDADGTLRAHETLTVDLPLGGTGSSGSSTSPTRTRRTCATCRRTSW